MFLNKPNYIPQIQQAFQVLIHYQGVKRGVSIAKGGSADERDTVNFFLTWPYAEIFHATLFVL